MKDRVKGVLIATAGVLAVTPDAVLVRWADGMGPKVQVLFWRQVSNAIFGLLFVLLRGTKITFTRYTVLATIFQSGTCLLLPAAFMLTYAANVMLCLSMSPLFAAVLGVVLLKDELPPRTAGAIVAAVVSMIVMFLPQILGSQPEENNVASFDIALGDSFALLAALTTALYPGSKSNLNFETI